MVLGAPECQSYTFDADGKVTSFTGAAQRVAAWLSPELFGTLFGMRKLGSLLSLKAACVQPH